ncbi:hypothetical protein [Streptomyces caatingaensis]|uniref:Uncharacterized protein n=1 Tax=Streptomyces caatingaensis TaxID=1678637 RepID=A0A0K9X7D0_9ACTN|nr:hypothetical protein [Streptomyces caatingaensis]KNB49345.1 hypothetical protein AC230_29190 [Streptomyces caatingaensis]
MTGRRKRLIISTAALVGIGALLTGVLAFVQWAEPKWEGEPYPVARPADTAARLDRHTQTVYDALDLPRARLDDHDPDQGLKADPSACRRRGLQHKLDDYQDPPPSEPHVVAVQENWTLRGVPRSEAAPALERVRRKVTRLGWKVIPGRPYPDTIGLVLEHPGTGDRISLMTYPEDGLNVSADAACAKYPSGTELDRSDVPLLPPMHAPERLRRDPAHSPA